MSAPFRMMATAVHKYRVEAGFKVDSGEDRAGKSISLFEGDTFTCKVASKDTDGDIYVFESTRVKKGGPSLHYHFDQDEWWYILSGEFLFKVGDQTFTAKAGKIGGDQPDLQTLSTNLTLGPVANGASSCTGLTKEIMPMNANL